MRSRSASSDVPLRRRLFAVISTTSLVAVIALPGAAVDEGLLVDLRFNGNHADSAGGTSSIEVFGPCADPIPAPPDDLCNDSSEFGSDAAGTYWRWESSNPRGGGFRLVTSRDLGETYTVGLRLRFDEVGLDGDANPWRKIIDYRDRVEDTGFYFYVGAIQFYDLGTSDETYSPGELIDLLAVRSGTEGSSEGEFTVYVIGGDGALTEVLSVTDTTGESIPVSSGGGSLLGFFFDDTATSQEATPGGQVYRLRIWDRALDPDELTGALDDAEEADDTEEVDDEDEEVDDGEDETDDDTVEEVAPPAEAVIARPDFTG